MKGSFLVSAVEVRDGSSILLKGTVTEGSLIPGMEALASSCVVIIADMLGGPRTSRSVSRAKKGQKIAIIPKQTVLDLLKALEGETLEFEDVRTVPLKSVLVLEPELL